MTATFQRDVVSFSPTPPLSLAAGVTMRKAIKFTRAQLNRRLKQIRIFSFVIRLTLSREAALEIGRKAQQAYREKSSKYDQLIEQYNGHFKLKIIPFLMESTGFLHKKSSDILRTIADRADEVKRITVTTF
jgi:hypothetical protein